jgi:hypothetical protein
MKSNVIHIFSRQYIEVSEPEVKHKPRKPKKEKEDWELAREKALADIENNKPLFKNTPSDLAQERAEHNESIKRQYRLT